MFRTNSRESFWSISLLMLLLALCWLYYLPALGQFFSQDDFPLLASSRPGWVPVSRFWLMGSEREYRPLTQHFYFLLNQLLFDLDPRAHHAMNLTVHLANMALLYFLARRWLETLAGALFAVAFYGFHSVHFYEIYWVSGIAQLGYVFFALLCMVFFLKFRDAHRWLYCLLAVCAAVAAFLSKEDAVTLPLLTALLLIKRDDRKDWRSWMGVAVIGFLLPLYLVWRVLVLGFGFPSAGIYKIGAGLPLLHQKLFTYAGWLLTGRLGLVALVLILSAAVACKAVPNSRKTAFLAGFLLLPMLPSFMIPATTEYYLNLSAAGLGLLLASTVEATTASLRNLLFPGVLLFFLMGATHKNALYLKSPSWGAPVPAKAEASRKLFNQIRQTPMPLLCNVEIRRPPILDPWEKEWLLFLPKLAKDRPDLNVTVIAPGELPPSVTDCIYIWEWTGAGWKLQ